MIMYEIINSRLSQVKLLDEDQIIKVIEGIINEFELDITQKTTLSTMKGSLHYHLKLGKNVGVLELTYWSSKKRLWVDIHDNRRSTWNQSMIYPFSEALAKCFCGDLSHNNISEQPINLT
jgi:hypothetical protein